MKHLTGINDLDVEAIFSILEKSRFYSAQIKNKKTVQPVLKDMVSANIFFENSTRTKFSFEVAQKRLGSHVINFDQGSSSLAKGESLYDTLKTFESLGVDIAVIRHSDDQFIRSLKDKLGFSIINAGAGKFEHPSQSLLDLFTILEEFGSFDNLTVTICGDVLSSRVAKSNITAFKKLGVKVILSGPETLLPKKSSLEENCSIMELDEAIKISDAVMFLRVQHERHQTFELPVEDYNEKYGLNERRMNLLNPKSVIMHPGPVNRNVEIQTHLVEDSQSRIFKQVENGVYTRMAILDWLVEKKL